MVWIMFSFSPRRGGGYGEEVVRDEGRAPDQATVDIGLCEQLGGVGGLDAAAIQDGQRAGDSSIPGADFATQERMYLLRLLRRGGAAGADRPDRLVGQHRALEGLV